MKELRVKEIINQRGISVREFAQMIGVSREYCYSLLKGEHASQKIVETMGRALNLPIRDLYTQPDEYTILMKLFLAEQNTTNPMIL